MIIDPTTLIAPLLNILPDLKKMKFGECENVIQGLLSDILTNPNVGNYGNNARERIERNGMQLGGRAFLGDMIRLPEGYSEEIRLNHDIVACFNRIYDYGDDWTWDKVFRLYQWYCGKSAIIKKSGIEEYFQDARKLPEFNGIRRLPNWEAFIKTRQVVENNASFPEKYYLSTYSAGTAVLGPNKSPKLYGY